MNKLKRIYLRPDGQDVDVVPPSDHDVLHHGHGPASLYTQRIPDIRPLDTFDLYWWYYWLKNFIINSYPFTSKIYRLVWPFEQSVWPYIRSPLSPCLKTVGERRFLLRVKLVLDEHGGRIHEGHHWLLALFRVLFGSVWTSYWRTLSLFPAIFSDFLEPYAWIWQNALIECFQATWPIRKTSVWLLIWSASATSCGGGRIQNFGLNFDLFWWN